MSLHFEEPRKASHFFAAAAFHGVCVC
jgi:hypothetical protein